MNQSTAPDGKSNHSFLDGDIRGLVKEKQARSNDPATSASRICRLYRRWRSARIRCGLRVLRLPLLLALLSFVSLAQARAQVDDLEVHVTTTVVDANGDAVGEVSENIGDLTVVVTATTNGQQKPTEVVKFWVTAVDGTAFATEDFGYLSVFPVFSPTDWALVEGDGVYRAQLEYVLSIVDDPDVEPARETVQVVTKATTATVDYVTLPAWVEIVILDDDVAPGQATSLEATAAGPTAIDLSWTAPSDLGTSPLRGYRIAWSVDGATPWRTLVFDTRSAATTHTDTGLAPETTRYYTVTALSAAGIGEATEPAGTTTDPPPPVVTIEPESTPVTEGAEALFVVTRTGSTDEALEVLAEVSATGSLALSGGPQTETLTMASGAAVHSFSVVTQDDSRDEADRTVTVTVMAPEDGSYEVGSPSSGSVVVEDDDDLAVQVTTAVVDANGVAVAEVPEDIGDATVRVTATTTGSVAPTENIAVSVGARAGSAVAPDDFAALSVEIGYAVADWVFVEARDSYEAVKDVSLTIVDDSLHELAPETLGLIAESAPGTPSYVSFPPALELAIVDDDPAPTVVTIAASRTPVDEGSDATFVLSRTGETTEALTVSAEVTETGSMVDGAAPVSAVFTAGQTTATLAVPTVDDSLDEADSSVVATVIASQGADYEVGSDSTATVVVGDNDDLEVQLTTEVLDRMGAAVTEVPEDVGIATVRITAFTSGLLAPTQDFRISVLTNAATAVSPEDYEALIEEIGFVATDWSFVDADENYTAVKTVSLTIVDDSVYEPDRETLRLIATSAAGTPGNVVYPPALELAIVDNDPVPDDSTEPELLEVTFSGSTPEVIEGETTTFTLARSGPVTDTLTVSVEVSETGLMIGGQAPTSVVFAAGVDSTTLPISTVDDDVNEPDSVITATITAGEDASYTLGADVSLESTVADNDELPADPPASDSPEPDPADPPTSDSPEPDPADPPTSDSPEPEPPEVTIAAGTTSVTEGAEAAFTLSRTGDTSAVLTVSVEVSETGSTIRGASPTSAVFDAWAARTTLAVRTIDDSVDEPDSEIVVTLTAGQDAGYVIGAGAWATVMVSDDDQPPPVVTVPGPPKDLEAGADGEDRIDLSWTAPTETDGAEIVGYRIEWSADGTSDWLLLVGDTGSTGTTYSDRGLTAGTSRYYRVCALDAVSVGRPSDIAGAVTDLAPPEVTVQAVKSPVVEGAEAAFTLRRTGATAEPLTVALEVSATAPMPGSEPPTSALFPAGADETTLIVRTIDDSVGAPDGEIVATLLNGNGYTLGSAVSATVLVRDNDGAPVLSITGAAAPESRGNLMFVVTLQGRTTMPVEAAWSTSPGTATADQDYATVSGVLTLDPGSTGGAIVIPLRDDAIHEENETFTVSLSRPKNAELEVGASSATGVIENDDAAPVFRIADASAPESAGEIGFTVSLSGESALPATVRWATEAETAQPGMDYVEVSGELVLGGGATSVRLEVPLIEDLLHEESETFRLVLSGATNAVLDGDSEVAATGTIEDDGDSAPAEEWLARFGRTAASNAVDALQDRLTGRLGSGSQVVVAGHRVDVSGSGPEHGAAGSAAAPVTGLGSIGQAAGGAVGLAVPGGGLLDTQSGRYGSGRMSVGDVLARSSFRFSPDTHGAGRGNGTTGAGAVEGGVSADHRWSVWGSGASTRFDGGEDTLSLNGEVVTGTVGADIERGRALFGVAVSHSRGDGDYRRNGVGGLHAREGSLSSELTTGLPYLRVAVNDRLSVWGALGRGSGSMTLGEGDPGSVETDIGMTLGAFGARQELRPSAATEGFRLALRTDLLLVHTTSDETEALPALSTDVNRLRLMIEGARRWQFDSGVVLTPTVELGLRYDDGDAETGGGLEVGAGLRLENAARGLSAELTGRSLLAHQASELSEWGVGGSLRFEPGGGDRGLSIGLRSTLGAASSGITRLWEQQNAAPSAYRPAAPGSVTEAEVGYGLAVLGSRGSLTPYLGAGLSDRSGEAYRAGARLRVGEFFALEAEAARVERSDATPSLLRAALLANLRW